MTTSLYQAFSHPPDPDVGTEPRRNIYRDVGKPEHGKVLVKTPFSGLLKDESGEEVYYNEMLIAYTLWGNKGPVVLFLHGVPTNRRQWRPIQERLAPFCRTIAIDMLGMGESDKPRHYGREEDVAEVAESLNLPTALLENPYKPWDWIFDVDYIDQIMNEFFPGEKFVFVSDDWGSGISAHYAAKYGSDRLLAHVMVNPISLSSYPISEIQAIGRASAIEDEKTFQMAMGDIDSKMTQILKTMVRHPHRVFNQFSQRTFLFPYVDVDYERSAYLDGEDATSMTLRLHWDAIRSLSDRAAILSPALLLPFDPVRNPKGVDYESVDVPVLVITSEGDNMMSSQNRLRLIWAHKNTMVFPVRYNNDDAGHLLGVDQPDWLAENILTFIISILGPEEIADVFLGFDGIWKGDEAKMIKDLRDIYGI